MPKIVRDTDAGTSIMKHYDVLHGALIPRDVTALECMCGGYMQRVPCNESEFAEYNCGRSWECCARAFYCLTCLTRIAASAEAPESD